MDSIREFSGIHGFAGISDTGKGVEGFRTCYQQASQALKYRLLRKGSSLMYFQHIAGADDSCKVDEQAIRKIAAMIGSEYLPEITAQLHRLFDPELIQAVKIECVERTVACINENILDAYASHFPEAGPDFCREVEQVRDIGNFYSLEEYVARLSPVWMHWCWN